jgi:hypothetical protein
MLDRIKGITPFANTDQHKPRVGAKPDTHTVRDDSGNTTQAMTQRRADRDAASTGNGGPSILQSDTDRRRVNIGAEYTTYHEPSSPEGKAILKDKKKTAKALKNVNSPKAMDEARAAGGSFKVAKDEETKRRSMNHNMAGSQTGPFAEQPSGSEKAFLEGGPKAEQAYRQGVNKSRAKMEQEGYA